MFTYTNVAKIIVNHLKLSQKFSHGTFKLSQSPKNEFNQGFSISCRLLKVYSNRIYIGNICVVVPLSKVALKV